jgi:hypothetical protein
MGSANYKDFWGFVPKNAIWHFRLVLVFFIFKCCCTLNALHGLIYYPNYPNQKLQMYYRANGLAFSFRIFLCLDENIKLNLPGSSVVRGFFIFLQGSPAPIILALDIGV